MKQNLFINVSYSAQIVAIHWHLCSVQVVKNKCAAPFKLSEFDILFDSGINTLGCLVDAAEKIEVLNKKGAWYSYNEANIGHGREKTIAKLQEDTHLRQ